MEDRDPKLKEIITEAIKLEINGREFFTRAAESTDNSLGRKMFQRLAQEEVKHLDAFSHLFSSVIKSADWKKLVKKEELEGKSPVIEELALRMKKAAGKSDLEALSIGMELEQKAIEFFKNTAEGSSNPEVKEIFEKIAEEERFHYDLLQAQHDSLTNSGFWLDSAEFQMDGKY